MSEKRRQALFGEFWQWGLDERGWRRNTRTMRMRIARQADTWLIENRGIPLLFAEEKDLRAYLFQLKGKKTGEPNAWTRNAYTTALQRFFDFLCSQGYRKDHPALDLPLLPAPKEIPKAFSGKDAEKIAVTAHLHGYETEAMVLLTLLEGLRRNEIRMLQWQRVNFEERLLEVTEGAKGGRGRVLPLHPLLYDVLTNWRQESFGRWVFESTKRPGNPWSATHIGEVFKRVGEDAGVHLHPHLGRHTFATHVLFLDGNLRTVQTLLGHASPATTAKYTQARPSVEGAKAVKRLKFGKEEANR